MGDYNEFRIRLTADYPSQGEWEVELVACPIPALIGRKSTIHPSFSRRQLRRLRNRNGWPNLGELTKLGNAVWKSVMTSELEIAFENCLQTSVNQGKGLKITVVTLGSEAHDDRSLTLDDPVRLAEFPVEALYKDSYGFLATDLKTPICRGLQTVPDRPPLRITLPLRVLVAVATPSDKPPANAAREVQAIEQALAALTGPGGPLLLDICEQPTRSELFQRLQSSHIFHFIGHGGFNPVGDDPTSQAYITLIRENSTKSDWLTAYNLSDMLRNSEVRLTIFTACVSAAATPDEAPYGIGAFDGIAQRLLSGVSGVAATVAMQFDMEEDAAVTFSRTLYEHLLATDKTLDEVVTLARKAVSIQKDPGHRAWVTPTMYSRCQQGKVFELADSRKVETDHPAVDKRVLREAMILAFNLEDLELLCADLNQDLLNDGIELQMNLDMVGGNGKSSKVLNLIEYLDRRGYSVYLVNAVRRARPHLKF
jgi:hypothetical protein